MDVDLMLNGAGLCLIVQEKPEIQTVPFVWRQFWMLLSVVQVTGGSRKREGWGDREWNQAGASARPPWWYVTKSNAWACFI